MNDLVISGVLSLLAFVLLAVVYVFRAHRGSRYLLGVLVALLVADTAVFGQDFDADSAGARAAAWFTAAAIAGAGAIAAPFLLPLVMRARADEWQRETRFAGVLALVLCGAFAIAFMFLGIRELRS